MDEDELNVVKNQLAALESGIKKLAADLDKITPENHPSRAEVRTNASIIDGLYTQACSTLLKFEGHKGPLPDRRAAIMKVYVAAKCKLDNLQQALEPAERQVPIAMDQTFQQVPNRTDHLPRIDLPRFNGSPTEWLAFKARFEKRIATIGEDTDKYAFLSKCLEHFEPARNSIEALENSGSSFAEAWAKLETRFYKKRIAYEGYFVKLIKFKKLNSPNAKAIMALIDAVDTTIHAAQQIENGIGNDLDCVANGLLVSLAKARLDGDTASKIEERMDIHKVYTWKEFKEELEKRANQLACYSDFEEHKTRNVKTVAAAAVTKKNDREAKSSKSTQDKPQNNQKNCFICGSKEHSIFYCAAFNKLSIKERWEAVSKARRCYNCMSWGHSVQKCPSNVNCKECGARHHTLLHFEAAENPPQPTQKVNEGSTSSASASTSTSH